MEAMQFLLQTSLPYESTWPWLGLGILALAWVVLRPMFRRKDPLERKPNFTSMAQQRAIEREMQKLLVDLNEMARQIASQLDHRAARLETLLREADRKIAELRPLASGGIPGPAADTLDGGSAPVESSASAPAAFSAGFSEPDLQHAEVYALADEGRGTREIAAQLNRPSGEVELILALRPAAKRS
jgi:hypothetical protein